MCVSPAPCGRPRCGQWRGRGASRWRVEIERLEQIEEALEAGAQMILLDHFEVEDVRSAVRAVAERVPVEVSGGVSLETVRGYALAGPDYIAIDAFGHAAAMDISLEIEPR